MRCPVVSVNLCVWNPDPRFFREAVQSIRCQTFGDWELVIVEDPSDRAGRTMIADMLSDERIRYFCNTERTGLVAQRNLALRESRAPWVAVLDADDIATPERLRIQMQHLAAQSDISVLGSWIEVVDASGRPVGMRRYPVAHKQIERAMRRYNPIAQPAVVFNRALALECGGYQGEPYVEDYDLWCRMLHRGARFANIQDLLTRYRVHGAASKQSHLRHVLRHTIAIKQRNFAGEFAVRDRLRLTAERAMLLLPPRWVYLAFRLITLRRLSRSRGKCCRTASPK